MIDENIDTLIITNRKIGPLIIVYIMIIIIMFLSLITFFLFYHYKTYYTIRGHVVVAEDNIHLEMYVPLDKLKYITNDKTILIDKKEYQIEEVSFGSEYITDNKDTYQLVSVKVDIPDKYQINNLTLNLKILKANKLVIDYFFNK